MSIIDQNKIKEWLCQNIENNKINDKQILFRFPFLLDSDDTLSIYITINKDSIQLSDGGLILNLLFKNQGILQENFNKTQRKFIEYICDNYNINYQEEQEQFIMKTTQEELTVDMTYFIQALIQLNLLDMFSETEEDQ
ncbi:MAG: DUF1828 domain-containing protein [Promethearchaeota archaeon]